MDVSTLDEFLGIYERDEGGHRAAVARAVGALATAAIKIHDEIGLGASSDSFAKKQDNTNTDGDVQRGLDVYADEIFLDAARRSPVALYASEEQDAPVQLYADAPLGLAIDPLDGSSNIDANVSIGTIFSLLPKTGGPDADPAATFLQPGNQQIAAGFFIYGPQLGLALSLGTGTHLFTFSRHLGTFVKVRGDVGIAPDTSEFAINASNYRYWDESIRAYVDDCLNGAEGPRGKNFNMRWVASLVAETWRVLVRGGVFLYPRDRRPGYGRGRLRLVYEANPISMLVEQAGGSATDSVSRILDIKPENLHQRVPLVFGAADEVARIARYHTEPGCIAERSPLFGMRGLFRT